MSSKLSYQLKTNHYTYEMFYINLKVITKQQKKVYGRYTHNKEKKIIIYHYGKLSSYYKGR